MYKILPYTFRKARRLGVVVSPSRDGKHKVSVYSSSTNRKLAEIGALGYADFPNYWLSHGKEFALRRRALYRKRHMRDRRKKGTPGYYADQLLW